MGKTLKVSIQFQSGRSRIQSYHCELIGDTVASSAKEIRDTGQYKDTKLREHEEDHGYTIKDIVDVTENILDKLNEANLMEDEKDE